MNIQATFRQHAMCVLIRHCEWNGIQIEIRYQPCWFLVLRRRYGYDMSRMEIRSIDPERVPLPITDTGYTSRIIERTEIEEAGGPAEFVLQEIALVEQSPEYQAKLEAARQGDLFAFMDG